MTVKNNAAKRNMTTTEKENLLFVHYVYSDDDIANGQAWLSYDILLRPLYGNGADAARKRKRYQGGARAYY